MKVSVNERLILSLLSAGGPSYGLQLVAASHGRLKRGGIYVTLGTMEQKGLVSSDLQDDGRRLFDCSAGVYLIDSRRCPRAPD